MSHDELYAAVQAGPGAGASMAAEAMWRRLAEILEVAESRMHAATARSADGWQGAGGDAARSGLGTLNAWVLGAATDARTTLSTILDQGVSAGRLRASMPAPPTQEAAAARAEQDRYPGDANAQWAVVDAERRVVAADEDARRKMEQYHWLSNENRGTIDFWTAPPTVLVETASAAPTVGGTGSAAGVPSGVGAVRADGAPGPMAAGVPVGGAGVSVGFGGAGGTGPSVGPADGRSPAAASSGVGPTGSAPVGPAPGGSAGSGPGPVAPSYGGSAGGAPTTGRGALPPGAGGRGPRTLPGVDARTTTTPRGWTPSGAGSGASGLRAVTGPSPTWRDLVNGQRGPNAAPPGGLAEPTTGNRSGGALGAAPRPGLPTAEAGRASTGLGGSHGIYPPMGGAGGGQGEGRRRASFLIDDTGAFEVDVPYTDPVIGEPDLSPDPRDR